MSNELELAKLEEEIESESREIVERLKEWSFIADKAIGCIRRDEFNEAGNKLSLPDSPYDIQDRLFDLESKQVEARELEEGEE